MQEQEKNLTRFLLFKVMIIVPWGLYFRKCSICLATKSIKIKKSLLNVVEPHGSVMNKLHRKIINFVIDWTGKEKKEQNISNTSNIISESPPPLYSILIKEILLPPDPCTRAKGGRVNIGQPKFVHFTSSYVWQKSRYKIYVGKVYLRPESQITLLYG